MLHVGDLFDLDVLAARAARLRAVHLDRHGRGPLDEPDRITTLRAATHLGALRRPDDDRGL